MQSIITPSGNTAKEKSAAARFVRLRGEVLKVGNLFD
jgi:hypothetical protein